MGFDTTLAATIGGGFFGGVFLGYALKKVVKLVAVVVGLFFAGLAYLQYQQIVKINWDRLQETSQLAYFIIKHIEDYFTRWLNIKECKGES
jgi:uncharacterized membrane protein (Fun14 family)